MSQLIAVLAQLNDDEKSDLMNWLSRLTNAEQENIRSEISKMQVDEVRTVLSVKEDQRIALFNVDRTPSVSGRINELNTRFENAAKDLQKWREERKKRGP